MFSIHFYGSTESQTQTVPLVPIQTTITMSFCFISWVAQQEENAVRVEFPWQDYLCLKCYGDLHSKGFRKSHAPFCLVPCALCVVLPVPRTWRNSGHSGKGQGREIDIWYGSWGWVKTYYCHIWGHKHPLTRILGYLVCQGFDLYGWKLGTTNKKKMVHTGRWSTCVSQKSSEISNSKGMVACGLVQTMGNIPKLQLSWELWWSTMRFLGILFFDKHMSHLQGTSDKLGFINSGELAYSDRHRHEFTKCTNFTYINLVPIEFMHTSANLWKAISSPIKKKRFSRINYNGLNVTSLNDGICKGNHPQLSDQN